MRKIILNVFGGTKKYWSKPEDLFIVEENGIRDLIINILKKENTRVSMAPKSQVYIITNDVIGFNILIDGHAELIKTNTTNEKLSKNGWKFREAFISEMIDLAIDWIENDRLIKIKKTFTSEMNLLKEMNDIVDTLKDVIEEVKL